MRTLTKSTQSSIKSDTPKSSTTGRPSRYHPHTIPYHSALYSTPTPRAFRNLLIQALTKPQDYHFTLTSDTSVIIAKWERQPSISFSRSHNHTSKDYTLRSLFEHSVDLSPVLNSSGQPISQTSTPKNMHRVPNSPQPMRNRRASSHASTLITLLITLLPTFTTSLRNPGS